MGGARPWQFLPGNHCCQIQEWWICFLSKLSGVSVFLSSCLFARAVSCCNTYELEIECPNPFNKSFTLVEPVQCLTVIASATCFGVGFLPHPLDDKNTISWQTETNFFSKLSFSLSTYSLKTVWLQVQWCMPLCWTNQLGQSFSCLVCDICSIRWPNLSQGSTVRLQNSFQMESGHVHFPLCICQKF